VDCQNQQRISTLDNIKAINFPFATLFDIKRNEQSDFINEPVTVVVVVVPEPRENFIGKKLIQLRLSASDFKAWKVSANR